MSEVVDQVEERAAERTPAAGLGDLVRAGLAAALRAIARHRRPRIARGLAGASDVTDGLLDHPGDSLLDEERTPRA